MSGTLILKGIALVGAIIVGVTAIVQLKNDWRSQGLDSIVTKVLLGLMAFGCILVLAAALNMLGART